MPTCKAELDAEPVEFLSSEANNREKGTMPDKESAMQIETVRDVDTAQITQGYSQSQGINDVCGISYRGT